MGKRKMVVEVDAEEIRAEELDDEPVTESEQEQEQEQEPEPESEPVEGAAIAPDATSAEPEPRARRGWSDRLVVLCLALGIAGFAFAGGRLSVDPGPQSVQEAMQMAQAGELPFAPGGSAGGATPGGMPGAGGGAGFPGGGAPPSGGGAPAGSAGGGAPSGGGAARG